MRFDNVKRFMRSFILVGLGLGLCLGGAVGQPGYDPYAAYCGDETEEDSLGTGIVETVTLSTFGTKVMSDDRDVGRPLEAFATLSAPSQAPANIMYWDIGPTPGIFDEGDVLYLQFGGAPFNARTNDIRLTPFGIYPAGSKVTAANHDINVPLTAFLAPNPRIVYVDEGGAIGNYDLGDPVYIKTTGGLRIRTGDVRLTSSTNGVAGSKVLDSDPDNGALSVVLHPNPPTFNLPWGTTCQIRFYNANGNAFSPPPSDEPIYDFPDDVYLDMIVGGGHGHVMPNDIRLNN